MILPGGGQVKNDGPNRLVVSPIMRACLWSKKRVETKGVLYHSLDLSYTYIPA